MDAIEKDFVEFYQRIGRNYGMDNLLMKLFAVTYLEPESIALDELARKTGYSPASVSNKVKMLETAGMMRKTRKPGTKKIFVQMEKNILKLVRDHLIAKETHCLKEVKEHMPCIIEKHKKRKLSELEKKKLKILQDYYRQMLEYDKLLKAMVQKFNILLKETK